MQLNKYYFSNRLLNVWNLLPNAPLSLNWTFTDSFPKIWVAWVVFVVALLSHCCFYSIA